MPENTTLWVCYLKEHENTNEQIYERSTSVSYVIWNREKHTYLLDDIYIVTLWSLHNGGCAQTWQSWTDT